MGVEAAGPKGALSLAIVVVLAGDGSNVVLVVFYCLGLASGVSDDSICSMQRRHKCACPVLHAGRRQHAHTGSSQLAHHRG